MLAIFRLVLAIQKGALLRVNQLRASACWLELHRRHRDRYPRLVAVHDIGVSDALAWHDVLVVGVVGVDRPFVQAAIELSSSDSEIELIGLREPLSLGLGVRPGGEHPRRRGTIGALDDESSVLYGSFVHDVLL